MRTSSYQASTPPPTQLRFIPPIIIDTFQVPLGAVGKDAQRLLHSHDQLSRLRFLTVQETATRRPQ